MTNLKNLGEDEILGLTIIGEARGESIAGQVAVGCVVRNRTSHSKTTYSIECLKPKQFSCWNTDDSNYQMLTELADQLINGQFITDPYLKQCMFVANGIVENEILDNTHGSLFYMTTDLFFSPNKPSWAVNAKSAKTIGNQIFFNV
jgi:hypothetical protein